jgi:energy-coupling factor transport system substrate-specific component
MGLVAGLVASQIINYRDGKSILKAELFCTLGILIGMGVASVSEMWVSGADINTVIYANFTPSVITNLINGLILVPILMVAYHAVLSRSGR